MGVSITRIVKFIRKGKGVIIAQSPTVWSYTETQWKNYYCTNGRSLTWKPISNVSDFTVGDTMVINGVVSDKGNITISLYTKVVSIDVANQSITAQSQNYIISGEDGKDAVSIYVDPPTIVHKKTTTKTTYSIGFKVKDGANYVTGVSTNSVFTCSLQTALPSGISYSYKTLQNDRISCVFVVDANAVVNVDLSFIVTYKGIDYNCTVPFKTVADGQTGGKGDRGPALRGPQMWDDCAVGYVFQQGAEGEDFKDVVMYNNNYYSCIMTHAKETGETTSDGTLTAKYWKLADKFEIIATKILLAQLSFIENLGVDNIIITSQGKGKGDILLKADKNGIVCNSGTFNSIKVTGNSEFSGTMKGVSGSFKSLNCVDSSGNIVGNITFGSDGKMWFDGDMYSQGYNSKQERSNRFYTSDVWCRGMFGHLEKTMAVVKGTYMYVYSKGADKSGVYVSLKTGTTSNNKTFYKIPLYGLDNDLAGMPIDVVLFNTTSDYYYQFTGAGNGKEWRVINGNDKQTVHFCDIGGWHELGGGKSVNCMYVNPSWLNPVPDTADIGRGVFWTGETDLNW